MCLPGTDSLMTNAARRCPCCSACSAAQHAECIRAHDSTRGAAEPIFPTLSSLLELGNVLTKRPSSVCMLNGRCDLAAAEVAAPDWLMLCGLLTCHCVSYTSVRCSCKVSRHLNFWLALFVMQSRLVRGVLLRNNT